MAPHCSPAGGIIGVSMVLQAVEVAPASKQHRSRLIQSSGCLSVRCLCRQHARRPQPANGAGKSTIFMLMLFLVTEPRRLLQALTTNNKQSQLETELMLALPMRLQLMGRMHHIHQLPGLQGEWTHHVTMSPLLWKCHKPPPMPVHDGGLLLHWSRGVAECWERVGVDWGR